MQWEILILGILGATTTTLCRSMTMESALQLIKSANAMTPQATDFELESISRMSVRFENSDAHDRQQKNVVWESCGRLRVSCSTRSATCRFQHGQRLPLTSDPVRTIQLFSFASIEEPQVLGLGELFAKRGQANSTHSQPIPVSVAGTASAIFWL